MGCYFFEVAVAAVVVSGVVAVAVAVAIAVALVDCDWWMLW